MHRREAPRRLVGARRHRRQQHQQPQRPQVAQRLHALAAPAAACRAAVQEERHVRADRGGDLREALGRPPQPPQPVEAAQHRRRVRGAAAQPRRHRNSLHDLDRDVGLATHSRRQRPRRLRRELAFAVPPGRGGVRVAPAEPHLEAPRRPQPHRVGEIDRRHHGVEVVVAVPRAARGSRARG